MGDLSAARRVAVVAPHPDDEVLGCGGTMARLGSEGAEVHVVIVTRGQEPDFPTAHMDRVMAEADRAHRSLGVAATHHLDLPAAALDTLPAARINARLAECLAEIAPDTLFVPFIGDIHLDHQITFTSSLVWARPRSPRAPRRVFAYETLSETNWYAPGLTPTFAPDYFVDIAAQLEAKLAAFAMFETQARNFPDERSLQTIRTLANLRGSMVFCAAAEAFMTIRQVWRAE
ncbi:GlcNAc-PI de-N-acetylase [Altererythrobacter sp. B11]|uniref:PIG-L deacetylase family protein n=1 Tax=Altererythrobacter sp. B11 TaxID=2060312 RepID=UPI000DC73F14|nr:PIG-L deacetylase family protein [Altererythrobacter sp. B11]BBC72697.1 GlcNAc-PI de-N-acetylase [Altererythrobacter sp. B11]